jgi:hypothetical protein
VTAVPEHTGFAETEIEMLTGKIGFTVMATGTEVAGLPVTHVSLEVTRQVTASAFKGAYV